MTIKQINMRAITNKKLFIKACVILHPCYSFDLIHHFIISIGLSKTVCVRSKFLGGGRGGGWGGG